MGFSWKLTSVQRLKGAIDSRIAEEQARQRLSNASPARSVSTTERSSSRNISPSKRISRQARGRQDGESLAKGPDPSEFEPEFVIEDDEQSRSGTPKPAIERDGNPATGQKAKEAVRGESSNESGETTALIEEPRNSSDVPTDIRVKLRKLEKLESRYSGGSFPIYKKPDEVNDLKNYSGLIVLPMHEFLQSSLSRHRYEKIRP